MVEVSVDMSEVDAFALGLSAVPAELMRHVVPVVKKAAQNIKEAQQADFEGSSNRGIRAIAKKVSYDEVTDGPDGYSTEIGIDKGGAGSLGNIAVFGTWKGGGTHLHPSYYAREEMPTFESEISKQVDKLMGDLFS